MQNMPFTSRKLSISDVILFEAKSFSDERGFFIELFKESVFKESGIDSHFVQDNFSHSKKGVLRGLHYQKKPKAQAKLVTALKGKIFDVGVDIRKGSPTYGKWVGEILSDQNNRLLYFPEGFAHGFLVLSEEADVLYKVNQEYSPENERGILWSDIDVGVNWPISKPVVNEIDAQQPLLKDADNDFSY